MYIEKLASQIINDILSGLRGYHNNISISREQVEDEIVVRVGEVEHPMEKEHYIMWIAQVTENKMIRVQLYPEQSTETRFPYIKGASLYAYCNKHGLWKNIIK